MSKFAVFFLLLYGGGLVAVLAYNGAAAFFLYQIVYMFNPENRWWSADIPSLRYSFITSLMMLLALAYKYKELSQISPWTRQPVFGWMLAFLLLHYIAFFYALDPATHSRFTDYFWRLVVVMLVAYKLLNTEKLLNIAIWVYLLGAAYVGYYGHSMGRDNRGRLSGIGMIDTSADSNLAAAALVPAVVLLLYYAWQGNWKTRALVFICSAFVVNVLVLLNSRGAFLGVLAGCSLFVFFMLFSRIQKARQRMAAVAIVIAGLSGALYLTDESFWNRMNTLQADEYGQRGGDGRGRMHFWFGTFDMIKDYPLGMGVGGYTTVSAIYLDPTKTNYTIERRVPHSTWFQVLGDFGWLGLFVFVGMLLSALRMSHKAKKYMIKQGRPEIYHKILALECGLIGFLAAATFIDRARAEILFWMILFLASASNVYYLQHQAKTVTANAAKALGRRQDEAEASETNPGYQPAAERDYNGPVTKALLRKQMLAQQAARSNKE
ncbi:O-antigen ligase family protein [Alkalimonas sp.]|uniref:O-antigen ligase family protein n=1 Tax=Alkalimonas sp. TaxID=1872453 RepID=UPI00263AA4AC|nr:O-antigen ligase family protein [Alkalimonas sp.]MCC5827183.1 O-antigen ligase family protein [Alkalimonas sp.]